MTAMLVNMRTYPRAGGKKCYCCQYWGEHHKPRQSRPFKKAIKQREKREWTRDWQDDTYSRN